MVKIHSVLQLKMQDPNQTMQETTTKKPSFFSGLTGQILIAMLLGAVLGIVIHNSISAENCSSI